MYSVEWSHFTHLFLLNFPFQFASLHWPQFASIDGRTANKNSANFIMWPTVMSTIFSDNYGTNKIILCSTRFIYHLTTKNNSLLIIRHQENVSFQLIIEKNDMKWWMHFLRKHVKFYVIHWGYKWVKTMSELISNRKKRFDYTVFKFYWIDEIWWVCKKKFLLATWLCNKWKQTLWSKRRGVVLKKMRCNLQLIILHIFTEIV